MNERKPLAAMESRVPYPIRLKPSEIDKVKARARERGIGPTTLAREFLLTGMSMDEVQEAMKEHRRVTA